MAKARSPAYPAIGLKEAIDKVRMVYAKDFQNRVPKAVIASHMGYKGLNGGSLPILAALNQYGLLEGRGDETRVSDAALAMIAHEPGIAVRFEAVRSAASTPELFGELNKRFPDGKGSDAAVRSYLLMNKFLPAAADTVIRSYRETMDLLSAEESAYERSHPEATFQVEMNEREQASMESGKTHSASRPRSDYQPVPPFATMMELPEGKNVYNVAVYIDAEGRSHLRIAADTDLKGAKHLHKLLATRIAMMEAEASEEETGI